MERYGSAIARFGFGKLLLVIVAAALVASGCGSGGDSTEAGSPIAEFLGQDSFIDFENDPEAAQAEFAQQELERQETIAACMKQQGFDYVPRDSSDFNVFGGPDGIDYDSREYAEKYGFGITTERYSQEEVGPELVGHNYDQFEESFEDDPNNQIVEAMDEATRDAYYEALYGPEDSFPVFDPETMTDEELEALENDFVYEPQGCEGEAWGQDDTSKFYQDFSDEMQDMYEAIEDDPRLKAKEDEIGACVAEKGYEFAGFDNEDFWMSFDGELNKVDELLGGFPGEDLTEEDFASMTPEELDEIFNQPREFSDEAKTLLGELQAKETAVAVAVWDCGGSFSATGELYQEVAREYEQRFLDENADRLAEYKADS
ncbi:MAG: hypothetical protein ACRBK7_17250 [Acidimicrobiales bacterium]